jgi:nucleoside-diphosphate-sugar epimerase
VVVTGATGFIGAHLVRRLRNDRAPVLALVRRRPPATAAEPGVTYVERDLEQIDTLRDVLAPGDAIVHLAARVHVMRDDDPDSVSAYRRTNVGPTRMLCRSAVEGGVRRVIYLSSAKVFGEGADHCYQRTDVPAPVDAYGRSKLEAEQVVRELSGNGVEWTIVRPPFVYGPGGKGNFPRLVSLARLATRVPLPLRSVHNRRSIVFVGNLVDLLARCAFDARAASQVLLPSDAHDVSTPELLRAIARARSARALLIPFPVPVLRALAALVRRSAEMERLTESLCLDVQHLRQVLDWQPPFTLEQALRQSVGADNVADTRALDG